MESYRYDAVISIGIVGDQETIFKSKKLQKSLSEKPKDKKDDNS